MENLSWADSLLEQNWSALVKGEGNSSCWVGKEQCLAHPALHLDLGLQLPLSGRRQGLNSESQPTMLWIYFLTQLNVNMSLSFNQHETSKH